MCGRYTQTRKSRKEAEKLGVRDCQPDHPESWNVAPTTKALVIRDGEKGLESCYLTWGLSLPGKYQPTNARIETLEVKPAFAHCQPSIIPGDGWYEWKNEFTHKQPYYFRRKDQNPIFLAGIFLADTYALITMESSGHLAQVHHRRPFVLNEEGARLWLRSRDIKLEGETPEDFEFYPVHNRVGKVQNNSEDLIERAAIDRQEFLF